jgi:hypothetical protein
MKKYQTRIKKRWKTLYNTKKPKAKKEKMDTKILTEE